jgi:hypothetical protein
MQGIDVRDIWRFAPLPPNMTVEARNGNTQMASDKHRHQPPHRSPPQSSPQSSPDDTSYKDTSCKPASRPHPDAAPKDAAPKPHHPPPEDEYGGGDIVSPEPPEPTDDDKPLS